MHFLLGLQSQEFWGRNLCRSHSLTSSSSSNRGMSFVESWTSNSIYESHISLLTHVSVYLQRFLSLNETLTFQRNLRSSLFEPKMQLKRKDFQPGPHGHHFEPGRQIHAQQFILSLSRLSSTHYLSSLLPGHRQGSGAFTTLILKMGRGLRILLGVGTGTSRDAFLGI